MPDYATMQTRISDEMRRDDLAQIVRQAILDAVEYYKHDTWLVNYTRHPGMILLAGERDADIPTDVLVVSYIVRRTGTQSPFTMAQITYEEMLQNWEGKSPDSFGVPNKFAMAGNQVLFNEYADEDYHFAIHGRRSIPPPVNAGDGDDPDDASYFWMTTAERMVRTYAKALIYTDSLKDPDSAAVEFAESTRAYTKLQAQMVENNLPPYTKPWGGEDPESNNNWWG